MPKNAGDAFEVPTPSEAAHARENFARIATGADAAIDIAEAALWIAAESCAGLDVLAYRARIDALAEEVGRTLWPDAPYALRIEVVHREFFGTKGFAGERVDYYDPRNSFLNHVIEQRRGIPISLSVLYLAVARANGLFAEGISFPGHFLAKILPEDAASNMPGEGTVIVDAFEGTTLTHQECQARLRAVLGADAELTEEFLRAAPNKEILFRMLSNLKAIFLNRHQYEQALACCDRSLLLAPNHPHEHRDRGLIYQRLDCVRPAVTDLERYIALAPNDPDAREVRSLIAALRSQLPSVH